MKKKLILLLILSVLIISCSLGENNGIDLIGQWKAKNLFGSGNFIFDNNNKGFTIFPKEINSDNTADFTWKVKKRDFYNTLELVYNKDSSIIKYEYYFSASKTSIYFKEIDKSNSQWNEYNKY